MSQTPHNLRSALESSLAWWDDSGVDIPPINQSLRAKKRAPQGTAKSAAKPLVIPRDTKRPVAAKIITEAPDEDTAKVIASAKALAGAAPTLDALRATVEEFDAGDLSANANRAVFARGNPSADIMVIGEAPGREEDDAGEPFRGKAGHMLDRMFAAIGRDEGSLYITNVCNWRPLNNRTPTSQEVDLCRPIIARHIELIAPKLIVLVGGVALETLTGQKGITKLRGQWQSLTVKDATSGDVTIPAMPLYHPAFLLRRPELKAEAWRDLLAIKAKIEGL